MANEESDGASQRGRRRARQPGAIKIERQGYDYEFPAIDFLFQNTGSASALLWQFGIDVIHADIDPTPELEFTYDVPDATFDEIGKVHVTGPLIISAENIGWGPALDAEILLHEPLLDQLFSSTERTFRGEITSGRAQEILRLQPRPLDPSDLMSYDKRSWATDEYRPRRLAVPSVSMHELMLTWEASDTKNGRHQGEGEASHTDRSYISHLHLASSGFVCITYQVMARMIGSTSTYCAILDPDRGTHTRTYPIAREIPPGDVERFHILVGATKSSRLRARFKFWIGSDDIVESNAFMIDIHNPRGSGLDKRYIDGEELLRRETELDRRLTKLSQDSQDRFRLTMERDYLRRQRAEAGAQDAPFLPASRIRRY